MDPFGNDRDRRRRRDPFDFFDMGEEFERMFREMERMMERTFRDFTSDRMEPGKSFVHGFNINIGPDSKPKIQEFGNRSMKTQNGECSISDEREPLTDIIEGDDDVSVTIEMPGIEKEDIDLNATEKTLEIKVDTPHRKYHKIVNLPCDVQPKTTKATHKNGVLDVIIKRKERKKKGEGHWVNIE